MFNYNGFSGWWNWINLIRDSQGNEKGEHFLINKAFRS